MSNRVVISIKEFCAMIGKSPSWFYRHLKDPGFPQPRKLGGQNALYLADCEDYIEHLGDKPPKKPEPPLVKRRPGRPVSPPRLTTA